MVVFLRCEGMSLMENRVKKYIRCRNGRADHLTVSTYFNNNPNSTSVIQLLKYLDGMHHRSIAKTRNQLDRISYKITQLKEKHTLDSNRIDYHPLESSNWMNHREAQTSRGKSSQRLRPDTYKEYKSTILTGQEQKTEIKGLKNQIIEYIEKIMNSNEKRERQLFQQNKSKGIERELEERIKKMQEDITNTMSTNHDIIIKIKKNEKEVGQKLQAMEEKLNEQLNLYQLVNSQISCLEEKIEQKNDSGEIWRDMAKRTTKIEEILKETKVKDQQFLKTIAEFHALQEKNKDQIESLKQKVYQINFDEIKQKIENIGEYINLDDFSQSFQSALLELRREFISETTQMKSSIPELSELREEIFQKNNKEINSLYQILEEEKQKTNSTLENLAKQVEANKKMHSSESRQTIQENVSSMDCFDRKIEEFETNLNQFIKNFYDEFEEKIEEIEKMKRILKSFEGKLEGNVFLLSKFEEEILSNFGFKIEKLENNFSYIHEKLSKVEYDNAYFKDRLTIQIKKSPAKSVYLTPQKQIHQSPRVSQGSSGMLDMLEGFSSRGFFGEEEV